MLAYINNMMIILNVYTDFICFRLRIAYTHIHTRTVHNEYGGAKNFLI